MIAFALAAGCGDNLPVSGASDGGPGGSVGRSDGATGGRAGQPAPSRPDAGPPPTVLQAGATQATLTRDDLAVDATGTGTAPVGTITIHGGVGAVDLDGEPQTAAFVVEHQQISLWELYEVIALSADRLTVLWLYCRDGALEAEYWEDSRGASNATGAGNADAALGTCVEHRGPARLSVSLPATSFAPPPLVPDVSISATDLWYDGKSPGALADDGITYTLFPFHFVDCSACDPSQPGGWLEVHSLFVAPAAQPGAISFGIIYLFPPEAPLSPALYYTISLPALTAPSEGSFAGTWSRTRPSAPATFAPTAPAVDRVPRLMPPRR